MGQQKHRGGQRSGKKTNGERDGKGGIAREKHGKDAATTRGGASTGFFIAEKKKKKLPEGAPWGKRNFNREAKN